MKNNTLFVRTCRAERPTKASRLTHLQTAGSDMRSAIRPGLSTQTRTNTRTQWVHLMLQMYTSSQCVAGRVKGRRRSRTAAAAEQSVGRSVGRSACLSPVSPPSLRLTSFLSYTHSLISPVRFAEARTHTVYTRGRALWQRAAYQ